MRNISLPLAQYVHRGDLTAFIGIPNLKRFEFWQPYLCCDSCASLWLIFPTLATGFFHPEQRSTASVERSLPQTQHSPARLPARAAARSVMEEVRCLGRQGTRHIVFHRACK